jgi:hypothetical protein
MAQVISHKLADTNETTITSERPAPSAAVLNKAKMCQLFLQASEKIAIPFVYQTMNDENAKGLSESNQTIMLDEKTCLLRHSINVN